RSRPAEPNNAATPSQIRDPGRSLSWVYHSHARDERPRDETQVGMVDAFAACLNLLDGHRSDNSTLCAPARVKLTLRLPSGSTTGGFCSTSPAVTPVPSRSILRVKYRRRARSGLADDQPRVSRPPQTQDDPVRPQSYQREAQHDGALQNQAPQK